VWLLFAIMRAKMSRLRLLPVFFLALLGQNAALKFPMGDVTWRDTTTVNNDKGPAAPAHITTPRHSEERCPSFLLPGSPARTTGAEPQRSRQEFTNDSEETVHLFWVDHENQSNEVR